MQNLFLGQRSSSIGVWEKGNLFRRRSPDFLEVVIRILLLRFLAYQDCSRCRIQNGLCNFKIWSGRLPKPFGLAVRRTHHVEKRLVAFRRCALASEVNLLAARSRLEDRLT